MWRSPGDKAHPSGFFSESTIQASDAPVMYDYSASHHATSQEQNQYKPATSQYHPQFLQPRMPPQTKTWKCAPCDLELESESALQRHIAAHITCTACSFQAAPKVVKAHFQARHGKFAGSGFKNVTVAIPGCAVQKFRICVGNRPEDIAAWIAERKKRFPRQAKREKPDGLAGLLDGYGSSSDEDEKVEPEKGSEEVPPEKEGKPAEAERESSLPAVSDKTNHRKRPCRYFMANGSCRNGANCTFSHEKPCDEASHGNKRIKTLAPSTLLGKLLQNDKKRENALTLQLIDYLVESELLS